MDIFLYRTNLVGTDYQCDPNENTYDLFCTKEIKTSLNTLFFLGLCRRDVFLQKNPVEGRVTLACSVSLIME